MNSEPTFWFPLKRYGWGWGLPVRWQGWVVLGAYFAAVFVGIYYFRPRGDVLGLMVYLVVVTAAFIATVVLKGERPLRWRWGRQ